MRFAFFLFIMGLNVTAWVILSGLVKSLPALYLTKRIRVHSDMGDSTLHIVTVNPNSRVQEHTCCLTPFILK